MERKGDHRELNEREGRSQEAWVKRWTEMKVTDGELRSGWKGKACNR